MDRFEPSATLEIRIDDHNSSSVLFFRKPVQYAVDRLAKHRAVGSLVAR